MTDIEIAVKNLSGHTLALCKCGEVITSDKRGIAPMADFIREGYNLFGYSAADRVVGKAAAMLFVKAGIKEVFAQTLSESAKDFMEKHGIAVSYEKLTDYIVNRNKDGMCPMESVVFDIQDVDEGVVKLQAKLEEMRKQHCSK